MKTKEENKMTVTIPQVLSKIVSVIKFPFSWIAAIISYFTPLKDVYILMVLVVVFDFFTGMWSSRKRKIPVTSSRLKNSIIKCFCYFGAVFLLWQFELRLGIAEYINSYKVVAGFIATVEIISILENMAVITGNPIFLKIVKLIRGEARKKQNEVIGEILEEKHGETIENEKDGK